MTQNHKRPCSGYDVFVASQQIGVESKDASLIQICGAETLK